MTEPRRERLDHLLAQLPPPGGIGPPDGEVAFQTAWEIRVFALAVAAYDEGRFSWPEFQQALVGSIQRWESAGGPAPWRYYDRWLEALEEVLSGAGVLAPAELDERASAVLATPRNASHHRAKREPVGVDPGS